MADLNARGQALFDSLSGRIAKHEAATKDLILEAARIADRLNELDDIIDGKDVLGLLRFRLVDDQGGVAEVKFDSVMSEARQQQVAFAGLMKAILPNLDSDVAIQEVSDADEIAARRSSRRTGAARSPRAKRSS